MGEYCSRGERLEQDRQTGLLIQEKDDRISHLEQECERLLSEVRRVNEASALNEHKLHTELRAANKRSEDQELKIGTMSSEYDALQLQFEFAQKRVLLQEQQRESERASKFKRDTKQKQRNDEWNKLRAELKQQCARHSSNSPT